MSGNNSIDRRSIDDWFVQEVLPLESALMRFLRYHWHDKSEITDLRQESYLRLYESARHERPVPVKAFLLSIARNLIIDRIRRSNIVSIDTIADVEWLNVLDEEPSPEQNTSSRQELRRMQEALDDLPPRCRQVILLRKVYGFSQREVAMKMRIKEETVESQVAKGTRLLADAILERRSSLVASSRRFLLKRH